ncbi:MAG: AMP-binding protein, partial [Psychrilyobacter sp.]|nr:AMP-binding protein [Psychrilyobacter sp.]
MKFIISRDKPALIYGESVISFRELIRASLFYAENLKLETPEEKVLVFLENRPEIAFSIFSIWENNGASINIDASSNSNEIAYFLKDANPKYFYTSNKNLKIAKEGIKLSG